MLEWILCVCCAADFCSSRYEYDPVPREYALLHATLVFKHGLRAPVDKVPGHEVEWECNGDNWLYPGGDSLDDELNFVHKFRIKPIPDQSFLQGNCRAGELLPDGVKQMKALSDFVLANYGGILPKHFEKRKLAFRSTYTNRCLASLQTIAHYLFPGTEPIDVFVANEELESLVPNSYICPAFEDTMQEVLRENSSFAGVLGAYTAKLESIRKENNISALPHWMRMGELLVTHSCANKQFPAGFDESSMLDSTNLLVNFYNKTLSGGVRFGAGVLFFDMYLGMRDYISGASDASVAFVCGHTLTFFSIFASLGVEIEWSSFGSVISFELLTRDDSGYFVRVLHNGRQLRIMPFSEFEAMATSLRPSEEECRIVFPFQEKDKKNMGIKMLQMSFS